MCLFPLAAFKNLSLSFRSLTITHLLVVSYTSPTLGCWSVWICMLIFSPKLGSLGHLSSDAFSIPHFLLSHSRALIPPKLDCLILFYTSLKLLCFSSITFLSVFQIGSFLLVYLQVHRFSLLLSTICCWADLVNFSIYFLILYF